MVPLSQQNRRGSRSNESGRAITANSDCASTTIASSRCRICEVRAHFFTSSDVSEYRSESAAARAAPALSPAAVRCFSSLVACSALSSAFAASSYRLRAVCFAQRITLPVRSGAHRLPSHTSQPHSDTKRISRLCIRTKRRAFPRSVRYSSTAGIASSSARSSGSASAAAARCPFGL